jgi:hypothetical protein
MVAANIERIAPQPGPQEQFLSTSADIAIFGGAAGGGKSYALLLEPLRNLGVKGFSALILRRTTKEVMNVGGLWTEAEKIYPRVGAEARIGDLAWRFPCDGQNADNVVKFDHLEHEQDKHKYQGAQCPLICFDELTRFTEGQFWYMLSRNRSTCGIPPYVRCTCNPDAGSWVARLISWWIEPSTGYPIAERSGVLRWFIRIGGQLIWANSREELLEDYPESQPKSLTFIAAKLDDNPALTSKDPGYRANLLALPHVEQQRLLWGNWNIVDSEGAEWPPEYFQSIWCTEWPVDRLITVVALDPSKGKSNKSDFSAFVAVCKGHNGTYYVDANIARRPIDRIVSEGVEWMELVDPDFFCCETNQFQEMLRPIFEQAMQSTRRISMRTTYGINNHLDKRVRIRCLGPLLGAGRIKLLRTPGCELLLQQLMQFGIPQVHDDGPDALEMGIRFCEEMLGGYAEQPEEELLTT